jgi:hypothetical protein
MSIGDLPLFRAIASKFGIIFDSKKINRLQISLQK